MKILCLFTRLWSFVLVCHSLGIMWLREDEIELELGLSIGGSFGKAEKLKPIKKESKPNNNWVADLGESWLLIHK